MKNHMGKISIGLIVVLLGAAFWYAAEAGKKANEGIVVTTIQVKGNSEAAVVLTEYSDFQCPACAAAAPVAAALVEQYGDSLRFEYKHFPLISIHPHAVAAAVASEAAGQQGKFWEMHDMLFAKQTTWAPTASPQVYFIEYAKELGLDVDQFKLQLGSSVLESSIRQSFNDVRAKGYTGTPTFELNGERLEFTSYEELAQIVAATITGEAPMAAQAPAVDVEFGI